MALGLVMERVVVRPLMNSPRITLLVATIAFALLTVGMQIVLFLPEAKSLPPMVNATDAAGNPVGLETLRVLSSRRRTSSSSGSSQRSP